MFKRLVIPLTSIAAIITLCMVVAPTSANERHAFSKDLYVIGKSATISEPVDGSVQVYRGNVTVANVISGDLLVLGGAVVFTGAGRVDGNLIYAASKVTNADDRVRGHIYPLASVEGATA